MRLADFDFELPAELIAQHPPAHREDARMLLVERHTASWRDEQFANLPLHLKEHDTLVLNNTRVFPARLLGKRIKDDGEGARVELFLINERMTDDTSSPVWETLARPARRLQCGSKIQFGEDSRLQAEVIEMLPEGHRLVRFHCAGDFHDLLQEFGRTPLPPYIKREHTNALDEDRERYQTVYARQRGAIAAPTAGLHFTPLVLEQIKERGAEIVELTLHVGYGTFAPVREAADLQQHRVAPEQCEISRESAERINEARVKGHRIIAVGTTTTRALESSVDEAGQVLSGARAAGITITPGYRFRVIDGLITNFHLPQSSLLLLVSAFAGRELTLAAYRHAVAARYRFYSYGDCMLII